MAWLKVLNEKEHHFECSYAEIQFSHLKCAVHWLIVFRVV